MTDLSEKLSAYLDGELNQADAALVEKLLETDPAVQMDFDALIEADTIARNELEAQLNDPVRMDLVKHIKDAKLSDPSVIAARPIWGSLAAGLVVLTLGGVGGYALKSQMTPPAVQTTGWLAAIADYHAVYASQGRHLVEVTADEADHIEAWLGQTIGANFTIPDLTSFGLTFEGGRLLVANAKPVAQLMYRRADGTVLALCLQRSNKSPDAETVFNEKTIKGFDFVTWTAGGADYVVIGPEGQPDLNAIAAVAAVEI